MLCTVTLSEEILGRSEWSLSTSDVISGTNNGYLFMYNVGDISNEPAVGVTFFIPLYEEH